MSRHNVAVYIIYHLFSAHCDHPAPDVANSENVTAYSDYTTRVGHVLNYTCLTGYRFPDNSTSRNITCQDDSTWSETDLPDCEGTIRCWLDQNAANSGFCALDASVKSCPVFPPLLVGCYAPVSANVVTHVWLVLPTDLHCIAANI